jgi:hypothetical protein
MPRTELPRTKQAAKHGRSKAVPVLGAAGLSLALAGTASAAAAQPDASVLTQRANASHEITLREEEVADVSLATFYVFDKEKPGSMRPGVRLALGGGCGNCAGCAACAGCWSGTYYTSSVAGGDAYYPPPPPVRPVHRHIQRKP